jgi:hypothetical protein
MLCAFISCSMEGQLDQLESALAGTDNHTRSFLASALQAASSSSTGQDQQDGTVEEGLQETAGDDEGSTAVSSAQVEESTAAACERGPEEMLPEKK